MITHIHTYNDTYHISHTSKIGLGDSIEAEHVDNLDDKGNEQNGNDNTEEASANRLKRPRLFDQIGNRFLFAVGCSESCLRSNPGNLFRFLLEWQALIRNQGGFESEIDWAPQGTEVAHRILTRRTFLQTRSRIDGIGLKARRQVTRLRVGSDRLRKRVDLKTHLLRSPGIDRRQGTEIGTRKVQTRCNLLRSPFGSRNRELDGNVPPKLDEFQSRDLSFDLEIGLGPADFCILSVPKHRFRKSTRQRKDLSSNGNCSRTKLDRRDNRRALLLKRLTQQRRGCFVRVARNLLLRDHVDFLHPVESTRQKLNGIRWHAAARRHRCIRIRRALRTRVANNHKPLFSCFELFETGIQNRLRIQQQVGLHLALVIDAKAIARCPKFICVRVVGHNRIRCEGRKTKSRGEVDCTVITDLLIRVLNETRYGNSFRIEAVSRSRHLNGQSTLGSRHCPGEDAALEIRSLCKVSDGIIGPH